MTAQQTCNCVTFLNGKDGLNSLVGNSLLEPALQFGHIEALTDLVRGHDGIAVLIGDVCTGFLLSCVAHLLVVTLALVNLKS